MDHIVQKYLGEIFPAAAITVIHDGEVRINAAWGWIDPEARTIPAHPGTLFDLASVTKLFTVTAFLSLAGNKLDDPLIDIIPEFGISGPRGMDGGIDPHSKIPLPIPNSVKGQTVDPTRVTFRHLLTHTSGLSPWRDVFNAAGPAPVRPDQVDPIPCYERWRRGLEMICQAPFVGHPGEGVVRYSDLGLMLLGKTVSRLHGTRLDEAIRDRVLNPLGLSSLTFNPLQAGLSRHEIAPTENDPDWRGRRCWGEVHDENACGLGGVAGHAGLFGTAQDVAAFGQAWLENDPRLQTPADIMELAKQEHAETGGMRRGLGWMLRARENASAGDILSLDTYGHTGFTGTSIWIDPRRDLVVACLTNSVYPGRGKPGTHEFRRAVHNWIGELCTSLG
jgi:CubicO group peptidase (beta-lactamase class C family)